jgi:hypothetical protein
VTLRASARRWSAEEVLVSKTIRSAASALSIVAVCLAGTSVQANGGTTARGDGPSVASIRPVPLLGSKNFWPGDADRGFGRAHPRRIFNGGDLSGLVHHITWSHWGAKRSYGWGKTYIFKPDGGYYRHAVRAKLRAGNLGHCHPHSHLAYRHLEVREPRKPGGRLGPWFVWSGRNSLC